MEDPSQFRSDLAIWTFVVFLCLLLILGKFAWGPIMEGLEKREQSIAAMIDEAMRGQEKAAEQLKQYEAKLAAAGEEARELVTQARKDAEAAKERILAEAQQAASRERQRAIDDIRVAKNVALDEITARGANLAVDLAGRIVRQQLNPEDHQQLIREAMDQLPSRN
jgi:F-type H+-transporting ATPase subunit b